MEYAPYSPVVPLAMIPEQLVPESPQIYPKSLEASVSLTFEAVVQLRADTMQPQSSLLGVGGRTEEADQSEPLVGQERAAVLVGVYFAISTPVGEAFAISFFRLSKSVKVFTSPFD